MDNKNNLGLILTLIITVAGWSATFGICKNQIAQNQKDITHLEAKHNDDIANLSDKQTRTDALLQSINTQLVELNTKMTLILNGKISTNE